MVSREQLPGRASSRQRHIVWIAALAVVLAFYLLLIGNSSGKGVLGSDFAILYSSARAFFEGESIYAPVPLDRYQPVAPEFIAEFGRDTFLPNLNPPFQTLVFLPLGLLDIHQAYLAWAALSLVCGLLAAALVYRNLSGERSGNPYLPALLLLAFVPTILVFSEGQVTFPVMLLLAGCWLAMRRDREALAGILLGLALSLKPFTGLLLVFFLVQRRWKLLAWCVVTVLGANLLALAVFGQGAFQAYREALGSVNWYAFEWNASLRGYFTRLAALLERPLWIDALVYGFSAAAVGVFVWAIWRRRGEDARRQADLGYMLALVIMLLVSPLGWIYYFPFLLLPVMALWWYRAVAGRAPAVLAACLWTALAIWPLLPKATDPAVLVVLLYGFYTYALVGLAALLVWRLRFT